MSVDMNKLHELRRAVEHIHKWLSFYQLSDSGRVNIPQEQTKGMFGEIDNIYKIITELEKINNYNTASQSATHSKEMISHPDHYQGNKIECIDAMLDVFGKDKVAAFCELNAFKYQWRSHKKGTDLQDKKKAIWYLDKYIEINNKEA